SRSQARAAIATRLARFLERAPGRRRERIGSRRTDRRSDRRSRPGDRRSRPRAAVRLLGARLGHRSAADREAARGPAAAAAFDAVGARSAGALAWKQALAGLLSRLEGGAFGVRAARGPAGLDLHQRPAAGRRGLY